MPGKTHLLGEEQQLAFAKIVKGSAPASRRAVGWDAQVDIPTAGLTPYYAGAPILRAVRVSDGLLGAKGR
jgi:hypothetical protein